MNANLPILPQGPSPLLPFQSILKKTKRLQFAALGSGEWGR